MNASVENFGADTANDRIEILQTISPNYEKAWLYTNKLPFLQSQYWPLVWGSAGLLRPKMDT